MEKVCSLRVSVCVCVCVRVRFPVSDVVANDKYVEREKERDTHTPRCLADYKAGW